MARNGVSSRRKRSDLIEEGFDEFSPSDPRDVHVLAVDDSLVDRTVIEQLLKISSCKVTAVDSGRRALQFLGLDEEKASVGFNGLKVDMIITDYCMPGMTGYELLKIIKGSSNFREIPVVIMSSENVLARIDRCLEEGAEDFIVKPVKLSDVKRLKDYMFGDDRVQGGINKRKSPESSDLSSSTSQPSTTSSSPATSSSPQSSDLSSSTSQPSITSSSPAPSSASSPRSSDSSSLQPSCSPTSLDSPTQRLKMTHFVDEDVEIVIL